MPFQCVFYIYTSQFEKLIYWLTPNIIISYVQLWSIKYQPVQWLNILLNQEWVTTEPNCHFDTYVIPDQMWYYRFASTWCFTQTFWYFWLLVYVNAAPYECLLRTLRNTRNWQLKRPREKSICISKRPLVLLTFHLTSNVQQNVMDDIRVLPKRSIQY